MTFLSRALVQYLLILCAWFLPCTLQARDLDFETLKNIGQAADSSTPIAQTLNNLKVAFPEYMAHYTNMYRSGSLQEGTYFEPRAIVFGYTGRFVMTFNGGKHMRGGNTIETMSFDPSSSNFKFREIVFINEDPMLSQSPDFAGYQRSGRLLISPVNPPRCTQCHTTDARPNWASYNIWPGAYGSIRDITLKNGIDTRFQKPFNSINPWGQLASDNAREDFYAVNTAADSESEGWKKFYTEQRATHERYKALLPMKPGQHRGFAGDQNHELTILLTKMNFSRIARLIAEDKKLYQFRAAIAALTYGCFAGSVDPYSDLSNMNLIIPDISECASAAHFTPFEAFSRSRIIEAERYRGDSLVQALTGYSREQIRFNSRSLNSIKGNHLPTRAAKIGSLTESSYEGEGNGLAIQYLAEMKGHDTTLWPMTLDRAREYHDGHNSFGWLSVYLLNALKKTDPDFNATPLRFAPNTDEVYREVKKLDVPSCTRILDLNRRRLANP